jgi:Tol biopolymer transport system component
VPAVVSPAAPPTAPITTPPVTVVGQPADQPAVSADGRSIVYAAAPATDDGRTSTVWLLDRMNGTTSELTPAVEGLRAGNSVHPVISADGCHVVAVTEIPYDLFRDDDTGARWDVYQLTLPACGGVADGWELISSRPEDTFGSAAGDDADPDEAPTVSGSGTIVAYTRHAARSTSTSTATDGVRSIAVVDRSIALGQQGRSRAIAGTPARAPDTTFRYRGLRQPALSDDGRFLAFTADAESSAAVPVWGVGDVAGQFATSQVYVWDRGSPDPGTAVVAVSTPPGAAANGDAAHAALSHDGRYVVFESTTTNLLAGVALPACVAPDGAAGTPVSTTIPDVPERPEAAAPDGLRTTGGAQAAPDALIGDGSPAVQVPSVVGNTCPTQIYRVDRNDGSVDLVSRQQGAPGATPVAADAGGSAPAITYDGSTVVFATRSTNLFDRQAAPTFDATGGEVVVATVDTGALARVSVLADGASPAPLAQSRPSVSADARTVVFATTAAASFDPAAAEPAAVHAAIATVAPQVQMAPLDVGTVAVGTPSPTWYVGVRNVGPTPFVPATIVSSNPDFAVVGGTCQLGMAIVAGESCQVHVVLTPRAAGPEAGVLTVSEAGFGATSVRGSLAGGGGVGALGALDAGHDFGSARVGAATAATTLQVANTGYGTVQLAGVDVLGEAAADFTVTATTCRDALAVGATCTVDVAFRPTVGGQRIATVRVTGDTGEYAAMIVAGAGAYSSATLATATDRVLIGTRLGVGGSGFPANATITLSWSDGAGGSFTVRSGKDGRFLAALLLGPNERPGRRTLIASTTQGPSASVDVVVVQRQRG